MWQKCIHTLFVIGSSFCEQHANLFGATKNAFVFHPKTAPLSEDVAARRTKNLFAKRQRKHSTHYLCLVAFLSVCPFFAAVHEQCVAGYMVFQHTGEKRGHIRIFHVVVERLHKLVSILQGVNQLRYHDFLKINNTLTSNSVHIFTNR